MKVERLQRSAGAEQLAGSIPADGGQAPEEIRAALSDARRSILHRQERNALVVLASLKENAGGVSLAQAQEALALRTDLLELAVLRQSRMLAGLREAIEAQTTHLEELAVRIGDKALAPLGDPRHLDTLNARLEALELWIMRSGRT